MSSEERLHEAVSAGLLAAEEVNRELLQAVVETARAIFGAAAASVFLLDEESNELVFEAVAGEGAGELLGRRFSAGTGIAGTVLLTGEAIVLDEVARDPRFAREVAESTGYMPESVMAVPLLAAERMIGVLEVLDRRDRSRSALEEVDLLTLFAAQAALALELLRRGRDARAAAAEAGGDAALLARIAHRVSLLEGERLDAARKVLAGLEHLLDASA